MNPLLDPLLEFSLGALLVGEYRFLTNDIASEITLVIRTNILCAG